MLTVSDAEEDGEELENLAGVHCCFRSTKNHVFSQRGQELAEEGGLEYLSAHSRVLYAVAGEADLV